MTFVLRRRLHVVAGLGYERVTHQTRLGAMSAHGATTLLPRLLAMPRETEWIEWKENNWRPDAIGEYLSALANTAALHEKEAGYIVWGIRNVDGAVVGTDFRPKSEKLGNQELENWLSTQLFPPTSFRIHEVTHSGVPVVVFEISPATSVPVRFKDTEFIRVGTYNKKLRDHPDKERDSGSSSLEHRLKAGSHGPT